MKKLVLAISFVLSSQTFASSILTQLPFGIKIGITTNKEIENRGVCTDKIKISDSYFRCETYSMGGGKFFVHSSENEIVNSVNFKPGSVLPTAWNRMGLSISGKGDTNFDNDDVPPGIFINEFLNIIEKEGASDLKIKTTLDYAWEFHREVYFNIDNISYVAKFVEYKDRSMPNGHTYPYVNLGLTNLTITENY